MVWGMSMPSTFGEFWPNGEPEGWDERLKTYYREQMPEEQKALFDDGLGNGPRNYTSFAVEKFIREIGTVTNPDRPPFSPIEEQEPPRSFETVRTYNALGSLIMLTDRMLAVDEALKEIIERLEPGVHQFFPIEIRMPKGKVFPKAFYVLVIGQYFDSFSPENSREGSWRAEGPNHYFHKGNKLGMTGLAFSSAVFGKAHLWRERRFHEWLTCFSDELQSEIEKAGLRIPKHFQMKAIPENNSGDSIRNYETQG